MKKKIQFSLVYRDMWQSSGKFQPRKDQLERIAPVIIDMGYVQSGVEPVIPPAAEHHPASVGAPCVETVHILGVDSFHRPY